MRNIILWVVIAVILVAGTFYFVQRTSEPAQQGKYDTFAKCLKDKGAIFYGAFWCTHCQNQKKEFGDSAQYLPYVECSTPDGKDQTQVCKDKKIESYPTWVFPDGTSQTGEVSFETLSTKTNCALPTP